MVTAITGITLILVGALPGLQAAAPAQTGTSIRYGETVSGTITEDTACQYYRFEGAADDPVIIDMQRTAGNLDGVLALYRQDGAEPVATGDDRPGGGLDPLIEARLPATGWYTIAVCRLETEQMRGTTGTFVLTLTGPGDEAFESAPPPEPLSGGLFEASPTSLPGMLQGLGRLPTATPGGAGDIPLIEPGQPITGRLAPDVRLVAYRLRVTAGDDVVIAWTRIAGNLAPVIRVIGEDGAMIAQAGTGSAAGMVWLGCRVYHGNTITIQVVREGEVIDGTAGDFELSVAILPSVSAVSTATLTAPTPRPSSTPFEFVMPTLPPMPTLAPTASEDLANPCQGRLDPLPSPGSSARISDAYTASGDGYSPAEVVPADVFRSDDDLNVVLTLDAASVPLTVTAIFCGPDGISGNGGEMTVSDTDTYLFGLDWESESIPWEAGPWVVEIYLDGMLDLALGFEVRAGATLPFGGLGD